MEEVIKSLKENFNNKPQLDVVFSSEKRILLEAAAGCGKTKTIVGRISYLLATQRVSFPKKILALTFSINAAYKLKNDVSKNLGVDSLDEKVKVNNFHSFARSILRIYGGKINSKLLDIDNLNNFSDDNLKNFSENGIKEAIDTLQPMVNYNTYIKEAKLKEIFDNLDNYLALVDKYCLSRNVIPYNAILGFAIKLLSQENILRKYLHQIFSHIIVDEFQDTNILMAYLLELLISDNTNILLVGDPLQQIYGFIGAIPNIFEIFENSYKMKKFVLEENFRFKNNESMKTLDSNIRAIFKNPLNPIIKNNAEINLFELNTQNDEAISVCNQVENLLKDSSVTIAILVKSRGKNVDSIISELTGQGINYFWALFTDSDNKYIEFHQQAVAVFNESLKSIRFINKKLFNKVKEIMTTKYSIKNEKLYESLLMLLNVLFNFVIEECECLSYEDKKGMIVDILVNNGLKQYIDRIESRVVLGTVHSAKGLEWDYVILPDMEKDNFPSWTLCNSCFSKSKFVTTYCKSNLNCNFQNNTFVKYFYQELSVFYVAVTRAKKNVFFSYSSTNAEMRVKERSCFVCLPGINF